MNKNKWLKWILIFVLSIINTAMNAQTDTTLNTDLSAAQQGLVKISALTATGDAVQLKIQLDSGLNAGLTINEIKEALVQLYAYCGFPRSLNALNTFKTVLEERKATGITDPEGKSIVVENTALDKYEQGRSVLETLSKTHQSKPAPGFGEFAPRIDAFLKEHLFADVFSSDVLSYLQRELVTIAALASMPGVEPQLQAHINIGKNTGITEGQLEQIATLVEKAVNKTQANTVRRLIGQPLAPIIETGMMVRIAELKIAPEYLEAYKTILLENVTASVKKEPGVICIFPMYQQQDTTQIRIVEIYANEAAYKSHLRSAHFQHYKTSTLKMVQELKLVEMNSADNETMIEIFKKLK